MPQPAASTEAVAIEDAPVATGDVFQQTTIAGIADHLLDRGQEVAGFRSMLVGTHDGIDPSEEGVKLARLLSRSGCTGCCD